MAGKDTTTVTFDDFGDGIDRRGGILSRSAKKFYELVNYVVTQGRKIVARPPLLKYSGLIDTATTQGCEWLNGQLVTIAPVGAFVNHTVSDIVTLRFDPPEGSSVVDGEWELLEMVTHNEQICALIRHRFPASVVCEYRNHLHVWDDARPTYVLDPACPPSWSPAFPLQPYGEGKRGAYKDYRPRLSVIGERLAMTTAAGDVALAGVALPRVWNTLSPAEILANGEMFYFLLDANPGAQQFTVPVPYDDLVYEGRYAAYVCEYLGTDGVWVQFTEVDTAPMNVGEYSIGTAGVTNRWDSTKPDETQITILPAGTASDGLPIRFRAIAEPPVTILSGLYLTATLVSGQLVVEGGNAIGGTMLHEGKSYNVQSVVIPPLPTPSQKVNIVVSVPGGRVASDVIVGAESEISALNGQERYWSRIIASVKANGTEQLRIDNARIYKATLKPTDFPRPYPNIYRGKYFLFASTHDNYLMPLNVSGISAGDTLNVGGARFTVDEVNTSNYLVIEDNGNVFKVAKAGVLILTAVTGVEALTVSTVYHFPVVAYPWYTVGFNNGYTYAIDGTTAITVGGTRLDGTNTKYTTQLVGGVMVEVNGEKRKVVSISSDILAEVELPFTTAGSFIALRDPTYQYAADVGDTGNEWYASKEAVIALKSSGKDDALTLGTSTKDPNGDLPTAVAPMDNRMLVQYPSVLQAWAVGPSVGDFRHLATMGMGAGVNSRPQPVLVDGYAGLPTVNGPRLFEPTNNNKDYVDFIAVGDMLRGITLPDLTRSVWWPHLRCWISCGDSGGTLYALAVHKDAKVLAWATWTLDGVGAIDGMFIRGDRLVVRAGSTLYYFDPTATNFVDANGAYTFRARWLYNDLGSPQRNKKLIRCEIVQKGKSTLSIYVNPRSLDPVTPPVFPDKIPGPTVSGVTVGMQRFPVMAMGPGIALEIESSDPTGHELDQVGFDFILLNR